MFPECNPGQPALLSWHLSLESPPVIPVTTHMLMTPKSTSMALTVLLTPNPHSPQPTEHLCSIIPRHLKLHVRSELFTVTLLHLFYSLTRGIESPKRKDSYLSVSIFFCLCLSVSFSHTQHLSLLQHLIKDQVLLILLNISHLHPFLSIFSANTLFGSPSSYTDNNNSLVTGLPASRVENGKLPFSSFQPNNLSKTQIWIMTSHLQNEVWTNGPNFIRSFKIWTILASTSSTLSPTWCLHWHHNTLSIPRRGHVTFLAFAHAISPIRNVLSSPPLPG